MAKNSTPDPAAARAPGGAGADGSAKPRQLKLPAEVMYLGPGFVWNRIRFVRNQIFNNGVPPAWLEWAASEPEFRLLFAPMDKVAARLMELKNPDSPVFLAYKKASDLAKTYKAGK